MKIVVDANVVIAALAKQSITKEVLLYPFIDYYSPDFLLEELAEHEEEIMPKMKTDRLGYQKALGIITKKLKIVHRDAYIQYLADANKIIGEVDKDDVAYIAVALSIEADGVWSYDPHFKQQKAVRLFPTSELIRIIKKGS
ncbi:MAG: PIN domain-containing protein [Candidatus Marsarchaeota archaeon]|jgi:predicted nucleic acid-binding protein|nr:PIN domain-containing protein [Candidatus Marsarchaeota archaeon]MCL5111269.1 PIN domain-containing protein [Candidatus Marsarchaeota archaeon]